MEGLKDSDAITEVAVVLGEEEEELAEALLFLQQVHSQDQSMTTNTATTEGGVI